MAAVPQQEHLVLVIRLLAVAAVLQQVVSAPLPRASASSSYRCDWCPRRATASLLPPDAPVINGAACGYGAGEMAAMATDIGQEGFHIAAVSEAFFGHGRACGACYQLRCRDRTACAEDGVKIVVVADVPATNMTGGGSNGRFLLTRDAFAAMMITPNHDGMSAHGHDRLASFDTVDVDFRRIPCLYTDKNLSVRVEETSARDRGRLALRFLYQGSQTDIAAVEVAQAVIDGDDDAAPSLTTWRYMTRREESPAVWRTSRAPSGGPLRLRIVVTAGSGGKWLRSDGAVLPADWVPGGVYDTGMRIADVAASTCGGAFCVFAVEDDEELR